VITLMLLGLCECCFGGVFPTTAIPKDADLRSRRCDGPEASRVGYAPVQGGRRIMVDASKA
jgi:hypothetical protein